MIERYALPPLSTLWSKEHQLTLWLSVEREAMEGWAKVGVLPEEDIVTIRQELRCPSLEQVAAREEVTRHEMAAFVDVVGEISGPTTARWIHYGLTSSDVLDTALAVQMRESLDALLLQLDLLIVGVIGRARDEAATLIMGRTHGRHAEVTTLGHKLALFAQQLARDHERLTLARDGIAVGKISGAVGAYATVDPAVEDHVCRALSLTVSPASSQVIPRDRHASCVFACASLATTLEGWATEMRHLSRSEVEELSEPFHEGQKGSSAMPHKRNPVRSERICGLARTVRAAVTPALENVPLWHERDMSHSSAERMILPDTLCTTHYLTYEMTSLIHEMVINRDAMLATIAQAHGVERSGALLTSLVRHGMARAQAYSIIQAAAYDVNDTNTLMDAAWPAIEKHLSMSKEELLASVSDDQIIASVAPIIERLTDIRTRSRDELTVTGSSPPPNAATRSLHIRSRHSARTPPKE